MPKHQSTDLRVILLLIGLAAGVSTLLVSIGLRHLLPPFRDGSGTFDIIVAMGGGFIAATGLYLLYRRTLATERNTAAALEAVENGRKTLEQTRIGELAGRFQKGLELIDKDGIAARIGGIQVLRDVAQAAPAQYADSVLGTLAALLARQTSGAFQSQEAYYLRPADIPDDVPYDFGESNFKWLEQPHPEIQPPDDDILIALEAFGDVLTAADAEGLALNRRRLARISLTGLDDIISSNLRLVVFERCYFVNCTFVGANLEGAMFTGCRTDRTMFFACNMQSTSLMLGNQVDRASDVTKFYESTLIGAHIVHQSIEIERCNLDRAHIKGEPDLEVRGCWHFGSRPTLKSSGDDNKFEVFLASALEPYNINTWGIPLFRERM